MKMKRISKFICVNITLLFVVFAFGCSNPDEDELIKKKVADAINSIAVAKLDVAEFCQLNPSASDLNNTVVRYDSSLSEYVNSVQISGSCKDVRITVMANDKTGIAPFKTVITGELNNATGHWNCSSEVEPRYMPEQCNPLVTN